MSNFYGQHERPQEYHDGGPEIIGAVAAAQPPHGPDSRPQLHIGPGQLNDAVLMPGIGFGFEPEAWTQRELSAETPNPDTESRGLAGLIFKKLGLDK